MGAALPGSPQLCPGQPYLPGCSPHQPPNHLPVPSPLPATPGFPGSLPLYPEGTGTRSPPTLPAPAASLGPLSPTTSTPVSLVPWVAGRTGASQRSRLLVKDGAEAGRGSDLSLEPAAAGERAQAERKATVPSYSSTEVPPQQERCRRSSTPSTFHHPGPAAPLQPPAHTAPATQEQGETGLREGLFKRILFEWFLQRLLQYESLCLIEISSCLVKHTEVTQKYISELTELKKSKDYMQPERNTFLRFPPISRLC